MSAWQVSRIATGPTRRFWRILAGAGALFLFGAVVAWCFVVRPGADDLAGTLITAAVILTTSFATFKIILNGNAPIHKLAAFHDSTRLISRLDTTLAELREHEGRLRHQALFDGLTGLANRTHFHEEVAATLASAHPGAVS
ncbi:MAG TPA: GGDEF domain-containing protein, partial [Actinoplanes sp.]